jgi:hypothetical protein
MIQHPSSSRLQRVLYFLLLVAFTAFFNNLNAQNNNKPEFVSFTFLKTNPGKYKDYVDLIHTIGKKVQNYQVQNQKQVAWLFYEVLMPTGSAADYDFVGVNVSSDIQELIDPLTFGRELIQKAYPQLTSQQLDSIGQRYTADRILVKRQVYLHLAGTDEIGPPAKYVEMDFMSPVQGKEVAYAKMEMDTFLLIHKQRMALGALKGWRFAQKVMPNDSNDPYPYITANFYDNFDGMIDGKYEEAFKKAMPHSDINKLLKTMNAVKKGQRNEIWKLVEYTDQTTLQ